MAQLTFEDVVLYAEIQGFPHRGEPSKAKDLTMTFWFSPWQHVPLMVLYEAPKRLVRGQPKEEVCWICVDDNGSLYNIPSRHIRRMEYKCGFGFTDYGRRVVEDVLGNYKITHKEA